MILKRDRSHVTWDIFPAFQACMSNMSDEEGASDVDAAIDFVIREKGTS